MTGRVGLAPRRWRDTDTVVAAFAGTDRGREAWDAALHALRCALPNAGIWLLYPSGRLPNAMRGVAGQIEYPQPGTDAESDAEARRAARRAVDALARCPARHALVFADEGHAPYVPAYLCYLAGIRYRAGFETEFGGAVLAPALPPPGCANNRERHLALLAAVGLGADRGADSIPLPAVATERSTRCER